MGGGGFFSAVARSMLIICLLAASGVDQCDMTRGSRVTGFARLYMVMHQENEAESAGGIKCRPLKGNSDWVIKLAS